MTRYIADTFNEQKETIGNQRLLALMAELREPMPETFTWNFYTIYERGDCGAVGCAIGLAIALTPADQEEIEEDEAAYFGMRDEDRRRIFFNAPWYGDDGDRHQFYRCDDDDVTPEMVADAIEAYLAR